MKTATLTAACSLLVIVVCALGVEGGNKVVCYFGSWAVYRPGNGKFDVEDIDPMLCTHLIFGFAGLDARTNTIKALDPWNELEAGWGKRAYERFNNLRLKNPAMKTILAIGGWNEGSENYSKMAANANSRQVFVRSVVDFLQLHSFNGLDMDWEYPGLRGGVPEDKNNFVILLKELREEFDKYGLLLTAAVGAGKATVDTAYDIPGIARYLHLINLMTYDFHGSWEQFTGHHTPLYARPEESAQHHLLTVNFSVNYWIQQGASREQLTLGMGLYGRSFTLGNSALTESGAATTGPGNAGPYTREPGTLGYNEICEKIHSWTVIQDPYYKSPYAFHGNQWVGYDDPESIRVKTEFAKSLGLGGGMVWSVETDDFRGNCHGRKYPLLTIINEVLNSGRPTATLPETPATQKPVTAKPEVTHSMPTITTTSPVVVETHAPVDGCKKVGYHRDPLDCSKFYYCEIVNGKLTVISRQMCAAGLHYDLVTLSCTWPNLVDCSNRKI